MWRIIVKKLYERKRMEIGNKGEIIFSVKNFHHNASILKENLI